MPAPPRVRSPEERLARMLEAQRILADAARRIGAAQELEPVLVTVLGAMRSLVEFRGGSIQLVDGRGVRVAAADPPVSPEVLELQVPIGSGLSGRAVAAAATVHSPDVDADPRVDPELRRTGSNAGMRSYVAVPLVVLGEVVGVLHIDAAEPHAFDEEDIGLLEGLATQVAGAIESARRHEQIVELEQMKSDFIARVSHELRTPLTIMAGFTDTLLLHGHRLEEADRRHALERVRASISRLTDLVEELLAVSGLQAGVSRPTPQTVDLAALLEDVRQLAVDPARVSVDVATGVRLFTDARLLRHAVGLLVDNALKYAGDAEVGGGTDPATGEVVLTVTDHGPGIPPEHRDRIWERFWRGTDTGAGMGLGLPVVRQLSASLHATVELDDAPGGGARFTMRFSP